MICKHCNKNIPDDAKYCVYCGYPVDNDETKPSNNIVSFKQGIKALFSKFMLFNGRSTRSEFNFGLLFLLIIFQALSFFVMIPSTCNMMMQTLTSEELMNEAMIDMSYLNGPLNLLTSIISIVCAVFLVAPIFRRFTDCGYSKNINILFTVLFTVGQLTSFSVFVPNFGGPLYIIFDVILSLVSLVSTILLFIAMLKKSAIEE